MGQKDYVNLTNCLYAKKISILTFSFIKVEHLLPGLVY